MASLIINYIILNLSSCLHLDFMVNLNCTSQEFLYALLLHVVALCYTIWNKYIAYIANILKAYVKDENNNIKNSTTFSNYIRNNLFLGWWGNGGVILCHLLVLKHFYYWYIKHNDNQGFA